MRKIPLLNRIFVFDLSKLNEIGDSDLFNQIISTISNTNGTAKTSYRNRFKDLDNMVQLILKEGKVIIHDTAVSTGVTSLELYYKLKHKSDLELYISDKYSVLYKLQESNLTLFFDADKEVAFGYKNGMLLSEQLSDKFKKSKEGFQNIRNTPFDHSTEKIWLLDPEVMKLLNTGELKYLDFDLFNSEPSLKVDMVRSMNILNTIYFEESMIIKALENIHNSLNAGGFLVLGRTGLDGKNKATIYQKNKNSFLQIQQLNEGSEIEYLVDIFNQNRCL